MDVTLWHVFETLGTVAFALSGVTVGLARRMDIFGIAVLSVLTAVGGGMVRDVLVGMAPPLVFREAAGLAVPIATALVAVSMHVFGLLQRRRWLVHVFNASDTLGLASFTVTGTVVGLEAVQRSSAALDGATLPITLGVLTAVGGGILRDIMAQRVPVVLRADFYAMAAIVGSAVICVCYDGAGDRASLLGFVAVVVLRLCALRFGWQLYHPRRLKRRCQKETTHD